MAKRKKTRVSLTQDDGGGGLGAVFAAAGFKASGNPVPEPEAPKKREGFWADGKVVARFQRKGHGGKSAVRISGLSGDLKAAAKALRSSLGLGVRVEGADLIAQGRDVDRVAHAMEGLGITRVIRS